MLPFGFGQKLTHIQSTLETGSHQKKASSHRLKSCTRRSLPPRSDLSPIRTFGSKVSALVPDAKRSKLESKCLKGFLVGYDECTKEYHVFIALKGKLIITRDVIIDKTSIGFQTDLTHSTVTKFFIKSKCNPLQFKNHFCPQVPELPVNLIKRKFQLKIKSECGFFFLISDNFAVISVVRAHKQLLLKKKCCICVFLRLTLMKLLEVIFLGLLLFAIVRQQSTGSSIEKIDERHEDFVL